MFIKYEPLCLSLYFFIFDNSESPSYLFLLSRSKASMPGSVRCPTGCGIKASARYVGGEGCGMHGWERLVDVCLVRAVHTLQLRS